MVSKQNWQTYMSEFESHWVPHSYGLELHLSKKKLGKLLHYIKLEVWYSIIFLFLIWF